MASTNPIKVLEVCKVSPYLESPDSATESSFPITFFDIIWLRFHPIEQLFFYELTELTPALFHSVVLSRLKHSLSLTLLHFLPLAGNLTWPSHASKPFILYTPGDGVALTVVESDADFHRLSGYHFQGVEESVHYIPELSVTDSVASAMAVQITYFPNQGFCIGVSGHHAILDGNSNIMFLKAWAHLCRQLEEYEHPSLSPELIPCLDRTLVQDPEDLASLYLNLLAIMKQKLMGTDSNPRSLKSMPFGSNDSTDKVRALFTLSREDIRKLRERVISGLEKLHKDSSLESLHLSTFVITYAYTLVCILRATGLTNDKKVYILFAADCRARLEPAVPANYFGNCVIGCEIMTEAKSVLEENTGLAFLAKELCMVIMRLQKTSVYEKAKEQLSWSDLGHHEVAEGFGVAGSTRSDIYGTDFGWGRPKKVEVTSISKARAISMAESKDGNGGVEIGCVLTKPQMESFCSLFASGLESQTDDIVKTPVNTSALEKTHG